MDHSRDTNRTCPVCSASMSVEAILCVACGYHVQVGSRLITNVVETMDAPTAPPDTSRINPYQSPADADDERPVLSDRPLSDADAARANSVVRDTSWIVYFLFFSACFPIIILFVVPLSVIRLVTWYSLNRAHPELREPTSLSPHCKLAMKFQDCRLGLWIGAILWPSIFAIFVLLSLVRALSMR